jgi:hypothetical protein
LPEGLAKMRLGTRKKLKTKPLCVILLYVPSLLGLKAYPVIPKMAQEKPATLLRRPFQAIN